MLKNKSNDRLDFFLKVDFKLESNYIEKQERSVSFSKLNFTFEFCDNEKA